ncbi:two-component system response regulator [Limosilactobacillus reuteri subsp. porcinus]|uniref:Two-component system response regulator n=1 Tax=Limosilactobacillus reuteri TaxID=1598 RepID=A0A0U5JM54_LIMRT|nr:two-component system response regulator [Limosilactobacillus reuteri subsp. porcinus]
MMTFLMKYGGYDFDGQTNTVDVYIRALRNKLGKYRDLIKTVRGIGYVLGDEQ